MGNDKCSAENKVTVRDGDAEVLAWFGPTPSDPSLLLQIEEEDSDGDRSEASFNFNVSNLPLLRKIIKVMVDAHDDMMYLQANETEQDRREKAAKEEKAKRDLHDRFQCQIYEVRTSNDHVHTFGPWVKMAMPWLSSAHLSPLYFERSCECGDREIKHKDNMSRNAP